MAGRKLTALCSLLIAHSSLLILSCDSIDCTLYNSVDMFCNLYQDGKPASIADTLTITALFL